MTNLTWFAEKMHKFSCTMTAAAPRSKRIDTKRVSASVFRFPPDAAGEKRNARIVKAAIITNC